jgi:hypothetical protein
LRLVHNTYELGNFDRQLGRLWFGNARLCVKVDASRCEFSMSSGEGEQSWGAVLIDYQAARANPNVEVPAILVAPSRETSLLDWPGVLYPVPFVVSAGRKFRIPTSEWPRLLQEAGSRSLLELARSYGVSYEAVRQTLRAASLERTSTH